MNETVLLIIIFYFAPAFNAVSRGHRNAGAIVALNLLLGWTLLGWTGCPRLVVHRQHEAPSRPLSGRSRRRSFVGRQGAGNQ